jgi:hypothetical protein
LISLIKLSSRDNVDPFSKILFQYPLQKYLFISFPIFNVNKFNVNYNFLKPPLSIGGQTAIKALNLHRGFGARLPDNYCLALVPGHQEKNAPLG